MNSSDNKNLIVAIVLMAAVWFGFSILFPPQNPPVQPAAESGSSLSDSRDTSKTVHTDSLTEEIAVTDIKRTVVSDAPIRNILVDTDLYRAVFTTSGARLVSFELKNFRSTSDPDSSMVQLFDEDHLKYSTLRTSGTESFHIPDDFVFSSDAGQNLFISGDNSKSLVFQAELASGLLARKVFTFFGNTYTLESHLELVNSSPSLMRGTIDYALVKRWDEDKDKDTYSFTGPATLVDDKLEEVSVDKLEDSPVSYGKEAKWTSFQTKYFLSVIAPEPESARRVRILSKGDQVDNIVESPYLELAAGQSRRLGYFIYIGPKDIDLLKSAGHQLERAVDFGFFGVLSKPLLHTLVFFYGFLNNYGLAIIVLTVIIKLLFWPLTHKSYASMKAMQKLQPEMQKIRDRFKDDKERLNRELMELYKKHRVNPLGGCLPMLVQIPVFFALYKVLLDSIALRHAPFVWWLTDLSAKDPYYITPLLMGVSMFVQQKMTPTTADPMQARIFMMMPIIFTFLFLNFPSGLVIYWLVNNLLTIVQQFYIHKKA